MVEKAMDNVGAAVSKTMKRTSAWWLVRAAVTIVLGILVLVWPDKTWPVVTFFAGIAIVVLGGLRLVEGIASKTATPAAKTANIVLGALVLILGIVVMRNPALTAVIAIVIIGLSWVLEGVATVAAAATGEGGWVAVVLGLLVALAGVLVVIFADGALIAAAVLVGIALIAVGILEIILFFVARSAVKSA